ncbi:MAG: MBL fold metallo-hydrolase [Eubacteriales bacterium]|nr:MBL fold metallo-hydrolase [Eubacteriales bacterium]
MKIINLIENTPGKCCPRFEHGLSFYVETTNHRLLIDTGATDAFIENAKALGVDLTTVDLLILSHGHYDHSGGILAFAAMNPNATILMQKTATGEYYHKDTEEERYIGIDKQILDLPQTKLIDGDMVIDDEISIFTNVTGRKLWPSGNTVLKQKVEHSFIQDAFAHEEYIVITQKDKHVLISGCAHNGILNILEKYERLYGGAPDYVFSGFHMKKSGDYTETEMQDICETGRELKKRPTVFYTGHCTGEPAYLLLKGQMGEQLHYCHSGDSCEI